MNVDMVIGADGANSRVAKAMDAGLYNFAIAFQERIKIPDDKMKFYEEMAEMYVGDDVCPDFRLPELTVGRLLFRLPKSKPLVQRWRPDG